MAQLPAAPGGQFGGVAAQQDKLLALLLERATRNELARSSMRS